MQNAWSKETEYFIYVVRCAVKGKIPERPNEAVDWSKFIALSKMQEVYSLIVGVLPYEYLPDEEADKLNSYHKSELVRIIAMKNELAVLEEELNHSGISFMLLKGSRIKSYYPKESMRQMSDVDILYDVSKRDTLLGIMKQHGYKHYAWSDNSDDFSKKPFYTFEFHRELFFDEYGFGPDFSFVWDNAASDKDMPCKKIMSDEDLYLHSIAHMYKHKLHGGIGIRFLCDTYLMLQHFERVNFDYIAQRLDEMKLSEFEAFIRQLTFDIFDDNELDIEEIDFLSNVMSFGIFGDGTVGKKLLFEQFENETNSSSIVRYAFSRMFPKKEFMVRTYPRLKKSPYLLLYFYIKRLVYKIFNSSEKAIDEIKTIAKIKKTDKE